MTTEKQKELLEFIYFYRIKHAHPPTLREMAVGMGLKDTKSIVNMLSSLEKKGLIGRAADRKSRSVYLTGAATALIEGVIVSDAFNQINDYSILDKTLRFYITQPTAGAVTNDLQTTENYFFTTGGTS